MKRKIKSYIPVQRVKGDQWRFVKDSYVSYRDFKVAKELVPPAHDFFILVLFDKGSGVHTIDFIDYRVKSRQIHMLFPGQVHKWKLKPLIKGQKLTINKALLESFPSSVQFIFKQHNRNPVLDLDPKTFKKIIAEALAVKKELSSRTVFMELVNARCRLIALMITLWAESESDDILTGDANPISHKFHSLVEEHYRKQKTVSFYARQLCITPNYLGIISRKNFRMSALEFIQERVLLEAKRLLHSSDMSIKEIAFNLGFPNLTYFSYFFKAKTGLSPGEYKRLLERS